MSNRKILTLNIDSKIHRELARIKASTGAPISQTAEAALVSGMKRKMYAEVSKQRAEVDARGGSNLEYLAIHNGRKTTLDAQVSTLAGIEAASAEFHKSLKRSATDLHRGEEGLKLCNERLLELVGDLTASLDV